ncbi:MAG: hypothetical protein ACJ72H_26615 [Candidatus Sulfotelmatobacter sp.]|jgi:hypothetical protein
MADFDAAWAAVNQAKGGERVSPELRPLLQGIDTAVLAVRTTRAKI